MQFHQLKRKHSNATGQLVGRGGKRGKTSGRGGKGQTARAGHKTRPELRDVIKRLPKLRGRGKNTFKSFQIKPTVVNIGFLDKNFAQGETVSPKTLASLGIISSYKGKMPVIKILGGGDISKKIMVEGCAVSVEAKAKIEKAGGKVTVVTEKVVA